MGIPKFFRYISERYPLTSQLIQENKIPEFDNLYLDFNGIIHNCSHPNDEDAHFRLSEEQIFTSIFTYVDHLFGKIKPKKLLFMAVDGVAPRAKMNQQRSRRFRTAKEARETREKAVRRGEELPQEKAFDSNCITPGTPFMARLSNQLRYFINKKITEDAAWREVEVILSGHEVPGEGEHKIMEYIRHSKAQPDYDPNVRHCLYGLDADLMMLGLLSHDPHFCLLREEVKFGPARKKGSTTLEQQNFFLLHISLLREYLDLEFRDIAPSLSFPYNLERVIDDFVLFAVFVGNDFLPNLPDLHIHENGLEKLFDIYKRVLPGLDGYLNESGIINNKRLQAILSELAASERETFESENMDMNWFKGKQSKHVTQAEVKINQGSAGMTKSQQIIFRQIQDFVLSNRNASRDAIQTARLSMLNTFSARDRAFIIKLANDLHLTLRWDEYDDQDQNILTFSFPAPPGEDSDSSSDDIDQDDNSEGDAAIDRVLSKYSKLTIADADNVDSDEQYERKLTEKMDAWKRDYYRKLDIDYDNPEQMYRLMHKYAEGLQWVMLYYYSGVASWGWFYDYHYAPRISDLKGVDSMEFEFTLGSPFKPFEQLMGVLPEASKEHIPAAFRDLMSDPTSPILDFYPADFDQDLNGKKQDWEAVVKIPFIDEKRLLDAMAGREHRLTAEEKQRNTWGTSTKFKYDPNRITTYPSSLPGFFPDIHRCQCVAEMYDLPTLDGLHLVEGLCDGVFLGSSALAGFPSLKTLPHFSELAYHSVSVFQAETRNKSIVVHVQNRFENKKTEEIAQEMVGKRVFIGWPFLQEGLAVAVSDSMFRHEKEKFGHHGERIFAKPHNQEWSWSRKVEKIEYTYSKRFGVAIGSTDVLVHVRPLKGLKRLDSGALVKEYEEEDKETEQVAQLTITHVESEDPRFLEKEAPSVKEEFPEGSKIFFLGEHAYGVAARVSETTESTLTVVLAFFPSEQTENETFTSTVKDRKLTQYIPSYRLVDTLGISPLALSRITSTFMVIGTDGQKVNLGLNLKFEAKSLKVLGYTQKSANGRSWEFSEKAINLIREYKETFPSIFTRLDSQNHDMVRASDIFPRDTDSQMKSVRAWLGTNGVRDMEAVSLFCDNLEKDTVMQIEKLADGFNSNKSPASIKKAIVKGIPREAVLKPEHAVYRLQNQRFALGDRVIMVQDSGGVPLCAKGVVIGLNANSMDVVWDVPFLSGTDLGGRCSQYRGSTSMFNTCLNLTHPQYIVSTRQNRTPSFPSNTLTPYTVIRPQAGTVPASGFRPAPNSTVRIMANPHRGRGTPPSHVQGTYRGGLNGTGRGRGANHTPDINESAQTTERNPGSQPHTRHGPTNNTATSSSSPFNSSGYPRGGPRHNGNRDESSLAPGGQDSSPVSVGRGSFHSNGRGLPHSPARGVVPSAFSGGRGSSFRGGRGGPASPANRGTPFIHRGPKRGSSTPT